MIYLPMKLSSLTFHALDCLRRAELDARFTIDMSAWLASESSGRARVCLAGGVMAFGLGRGVDDLTPSAFEEYNGVRLSALEEMRAGRVEAALKDMRFSDVEIAHLPRELCRVDVTRYDTCPRQFRLDQRALAGQLFDLGF